MCIIRFTLDYISEMRTFCLLVVSNSMPLHPAWQGDLNSTPLEPQTGLNAPWGQWHLALHSEELELKTGKTWVFQTLEICLGSMMKVLSLVCWCLLPRRKDPIDLLGGAAKEQQWQRGEQADQDSTRTQLAGAADRKFQPSHHHSSQDGAQYCHWDTDTSWTGNDMQSASAPLCKLKPLKTSHRSIWWTRRPSGWTVSQWTWPWRWRGRPAALPGSPGPGLPAGRRGSASFAAQREENLKSGGGG